MYKGFVHTHYLAVSLFFVLYLIKTILLLSDRQELLVKFSRKTKVFEMIVSTLFLVTGIYLALHLPFNSKYDYLFYIKLVMVFSSIPLAIVAFKKGNKILAALSLLLITGSYGLAEVYSKKKAISKTGSNISATTTNGRELYEAKCSLCHGNDGKLGASGATDISATALDRQGISSVILQGKGLMNPVDVTDEQAQSIAAYVDEELKGR